MTSEDLASVDDLPAGIASLLEGEPVPDADGPVFETPWQARAFGLAVALGRDGRYDWGEFQERFVDEVAGMDPEVDPDDLEADYHGRWLAALEGLLVEEGVLDAAEIERRAAEFAAGDRDASEFVAGDREHGSGELLSAEGDDA